MNENGSGNTQRLDRWLWHARFFKTRRLAAQICASGKLRVDGRRIDKPGRRVGPGNVLTFAQGRRVRVVRVRDMAPRRVSAAEAAGLYDDLSPDPPPRKDRAPQQARREKGAGRPTKAARRAIDKLMRRS